MTTRNIDQNSPEKEHVLLSSDERAIFSQIAAMEAPYSQRAQALLALDEGATQAEAGRQAGLSQGQVQYWLAKFRRNGKDAFPEGLLNQAEPVEAELDQGSVKQASSSDVQDLEQSEDEEDAQQEMLDTKETAEPVDAATAKPEKKPKTKKKSKKKPKKKPKKKSKKAKKAVKAKAPKKGKKKSKKKKSKKKAGGEKSKSGKKKAKK